MTGLCRRRFARGGRNFESPSSSFWLEVWRGAGACCRAPGGRVPASPPARLAPRGPLFSPLPSQVRKHGAKLLASMVNGMDDKDDPHNLVALEAMSSLSKLLDHVEERDIQSMLLHIAIRIRPFFDSVRHRPGCARAAELVALPARQKGLVCRARACLTQGTCAGAAGVCSDVTGHMPGCRQRCGAGGRRLGCRIPSWELSTSCIKTRCGWEAEVPVASSAWTLTRPGWQEALGAGLSQSWLLWVPWGRSKGRVRPGRGEKSSADLSQGVSLPLAVSVHPPSPSSITTEKLDASAQLAARPGA